MSKSDDLIYHLLPEKELGITYPDITGKLGLHILDSWCFCDPAFNKTCGLWLHRRVIWN